MEVAVINLIRRETTIPVPKIVAWGVAAQNPLGLGPFIIMEFIQDRSSQAEPSPKSNLSPALYEP